MKETDEHQTNKKREKPDNDSSYEEAEVFKKSKTTQRSPPKKIDKDKKEVETGKMEEIRDMFKEIKEEIQGIKKTVKETNEEVVRLRTEMNIMKEEWQKEKESLQGELEKTQKRLEMVERDRIRNNLVVFGLKMDTTGNEELKEGMENMLERELNVKVNLKAVRKMGPKRCLVELREWKEKREILERKRHLKGKNIYIDSEMTSKELETQMILRNIAKAEREKGTEVKIKFQKILINGKTMKWNEKRKSLEEVKELQTKN